jgi:hypothetical protein
MKHSFVRAVFLAALTAATHAHADELVVAFNTMAGVSGPFKGAANPIRGVPGGGLAWKLDQVSGELKRSGRLEIRIRGLVFAEGPNVGRNTVPNFRAIVSCQITNQSGSPDFLTLMTGLFPATSTGDADIEENLNLPAQCLAPIVFVTSPTGSWFAVTGY